VMSRELRPITTLTAFDALSLTGGLVSSGQRSRRAVAVRPESVGHSSMPPARCRKVKQVIFEISQDVKKGFCARCLTENVSTEAETWEQLRANIRQAVREFSVDHYRPNQIQLHIVRDETLTLK
jgi:hypothetical protein